MSAVAVTRRSGTRHQDWRSRTACDGADVNLFFPPEDAGRNAAKAAKAICARCPVTADCLAHAEAWGIWGGLTERERRKPRSRSSAFPGVTWNRKARKWVARVVIDSRRVYLGTFADEAEAGRAAAEARPAPQASPIPQPTETAA